MGCSAVLLLSLFVVASVSAAELEDISLGKCVDNKKHLNYFRLDLFSGKWYENATMNRVPYTPGRCGTVEYSVDYARDYVNIHETEMVEDKEVEYNSTLYKINRGDYYRYNVLYENTKNLPYNQPKLRLLYKLLGTDYDCWAVVYTCIGEPSIHKEIVTVLLRTRKKTCLNKKTNKEVETLIKDVLFKDFLKDFSFTNHTDCKDEEAKADEDTGEDTEAGEAKTEAGKETTPEGEKVKETTLEEKKEKEKTPVKEKKAEKEKSSGTEEKTVEEKPAGGENTAENPKTEEEPKPGAEAPAKKKKKAKPAAEA